VGYDRLTQHFTVHISCLNSNKSIKVAKKSGTASPAAGIEYEPCRAIDEQRDRSPVPTPSTNSALSKKGLN